MTLSIWPIGALINIAPSVFGTVVAVQIGCGNAVSYQVAWWNGSDRKTDWINEIELSADMKDSGRVKIGFRSI